MNIQDDIDPQIDNLPQDSYNWLVENRSTIADLQEWLNEQEEDNG